MVKRYCIYFLQFIDSETRHKMKTDKAIITACSLPNMSRPRLTTDDTPHRVFHIQDKFFLKPFMTPSKKIEQHFLEALLCLYFTHIPYLNTPYYVVRHGKGKNKYQTCQKNHTSPENPMKAIARRLAVIRAIGIPLKALGTLLSASCSRRPAKSTIASPKPREVENAYHAASPRL